VAIQKINNALLYALSTDTKPTNHAVNTILYEFDTGQIYKYTGATTGWKFFTGGSNFAYRRAGTTPNRWYIGGQTNAAATGTLALTTNTFYAVPIVIEAKKTLSDLGINTSTASASSAYRLGVYTDDGNNYPASLVAETSTQPVGTAIAFTSATFTTTPSLDPGLYWLAVNVTATPTVRAITPAGALNILGTDNAAATTATGMGWSVTRTYAALPATFTTGAAIMVATTGIPAIYARFI
jgi:hypothetical protein